MDRRVAELLIIVLLLTLMVFSNQIIDFTGKVASGTIRLGVQLKEEATIVLTHPAAIDLGDSITIGAEVVNTGSTSYTIRPEISIKNTNLTNLVTYYDGYNNLIPGAYREFITTYYPNESGFYWIQGKVRLSSDDVIAWGLFYVRPVPPVYVYIPGTVGTTTVIRDYERGPIIHDLSLDYPRKLSLIRGQSLIIPVQVKNIRKEALQDIVLELSHKLPVVDVVPEKIDRLNSQESGLFHISVTAPKEFPLGSYDLVFTLKTYELNRTETISITVIEDDLRNEVLETINNYMFILNLLKGKASSAAQEGKNVSKAVEYLNLADSDLEKTIVIFNTGQYLLAKDQLFIVKGNLEKAILELSRLGIIQQILLPAFLPYIFLIAFLASLPFMMLIYWRRKSKEEKHRGLR